MPTKKKSEKKKSEEHKTKEHKSETKKSKDSIFSNYWAVASIVLAILLIIALTMNMGSSVSKKEAGEIVLEFAESQGVSAEISSIEKEGSLYLVTLSISGNEAPVYITQDGKYFIAAQYLVPLEEVSKNPSPQPQPTPSTYTEEQKAEILEFSQCLADKGIQAYGAGWCSFCKKLKETFGGDATTGAELISPFYLECQNTDRSPTEYAELCEEEQISGFPTIKFNGEQSSLSALSSFDDFAQVTGCEAPAL